MRHTFESLGYQSVFYLSHLFSSTRNTSSFLHSLRSNPPFKSARLLRTSTGVKSNFHLQLLCFLHPISQTLPGLDFHKLKMRPICKTAQTETLILYVLRLEKEGSKHIFFVVLVTIKCVVICNKEKPPSFCGQSLYY